MKMPWRRKWWPTLVLVPEKSHEKSVVGYSPKGRKESDTTEFNDSQNLMTGAFKKRGNWDTGAQGRDTQAMRTWRQASGSLWCLYEPRNAKDCWRTPEVGETHETNSSFRTSRKNHTCQHLGVKHLSLQNCYRVHSCCFKLLSLWYFIVATIGNQHSGAARCLPTPAPSHSALTPTVLISAWGQKTKSRK